MDECSVATKILAEGSGEGGQGGRQRREDVRGYEAEVRTSMQGVRRRGGD